MLESIISFLGVVSQGVEEKSFDFFDGGGGLTRCVSSVQQPVIARRASQHQ